LIFLKKNIDGSLSQLSMLILKHNHIDYMYPASCKYIIVVFKCTEKYHRKTSLVNIIVLFVCG
jgi:hypothetical protein